jgi:hypothetical protein
MDVLRCERRAPAVQRVPWRQRGGAMARVSTYLNFMGKAEEALEFYR